MPWSTKKGSDHLYKKNFGFYNKILGYTVNENLRNEQLPKLKPFLSNDDYDEYETLINKNFNGLDDLEHISRKMYGYKKAEDYYEEVTVGEHCSKIKVPTFSLDAKDDMICDFS